MCPAQCWYCCDSWRNRNITYSLYLHLSFLLIVPVKLGDLPNKWRQIGRTKKKKFGKIRVLSDAHQTFRSPTGFSVPQYRCSPNTITECAIFMAPPNAPISIRLLKDCTTIRRIDSGVWCADDFMFGHVGGRWSSLVRGRFVFVYFSSPFNNLWFSSSNHLVYLANAISLCLCKTCRQKCLNNMSLFFQIFFLPKSWWLQLASQCTCRKSHVYRFESDFSFTAIYF